MVGSSENQRELSRANASGIARDFKPEGARSGIPRMRLKRWQAWLLFAAALFCLASVSRSMWLWFGTPAWGPRLSCDEPYFHFGEVQTGAAIEHRFYLYNSGGQDLSINRVRATCGCLTPMLSGTAISPGQGLYVPVRIALREHRGQLKGRVLVESNDTNTPFFVLRVEGMVRSHIRLRPEEIAFGEVTPASVVPKVIDITPADPAVPLTVREVSCDSRVFVPQLSSGPKENTFRVAVGLNKNAARGRLTGTILISTDLPDEATLRVPVSATLVGSR